MKYAVLIAFVALGLWLWQRNRAINRRDNARGASDANASAAKAKARGSAVTQMVACSTCGLHLPKADALLGTRGVYCCAGHQRQADD